MFVNDSRRCISAAKGGTGPDRPERADAAGGESYCLVLTNRVFQNKMEGKIFVFYSNAAYKKDFDLSNEISGEYFSLNFYKKENKYIYYTLAYTDNHIFKLAYYKMNIE